MWVFPYGETLAVLINVCISADEKSFKNTIDLIIIDIPFATETLVNEFFFWNSAENEL